ncbi:MAG: serine protease [Oligoflexia bacterium]|nr:serine protease [Oligoflexia bacterium]
MIILKSLRPSLICLISISFLFALVSLITINNSSYANHIKNNNIRKILGGETIKAPAYFASLAFRSPKEGGGFEFFALCGGTLIKNDNIAVVLTAAHCVEDLKEKIIVSLKADKQSDIKENTVINVKAVYVHPLYNPNIIINDVAILILDETNPLLKNPELKTIPIYLDSTEQADRELSVVGFGNISSYGGLWADELYSVNLREVSSEACRNANKDDSIQGQRQICAGEVVAGGKDSCWGDSGGPLLIGEGSNVQLMGVVSWGQGCGQKKFPGIYTRLSYYLPWINSILNLYSPNTSNNSEREYSATEIASVAEATCYDKSMVKENMILADANDPKSLNLSFFLRGGIYQKQSIMDVVASNTNINDDKIIHECSFTMPNGKKFNKNIYLKNATQVTTGLYSYEGIIKSVESVGSDIAVNETYKANYDFKVKQELKCKNIELTFEKNFADYLLLSTNNTKYAREEVANNESKPPQIISVELPTDYKQISTCSYTDNYSNPVSVTLFSKDGTLTDEIISKTQSKSYYNNNLYEVLSKVKADAEGDDGSESSGETRGTVDLHFKSFQSFGENNFVLADVDIVNNTNYDLISWRLTNKMGVKFLLLDPTSPIPAADDADLNSKLNSSSEKFIVFKSKWGFIATKEKVSFKIIMELNSVAIFDNPIFKNSFSINEQIAKIITND